MWSSFAERTLYLDANVIIYAIERNHSWSRTTKFLLDAIDRKALRAVTSELALAEVLAKPMARNDHNLLQKYQRLFAPDSELAMIQIDRDVLVLAARLQGELKVKLFDAIHLSTARLSGCDFFLTEDERLGRALGDQPKWLRLSEVD